MANIGKMAVMLQANAAPFKAGMKSAIAPVNALSGGFAGLGASVMKVTSILSGIGTALAGGGAMVMLKKSFDDIDRLAKSADALGMTTKALGGLQMAADLAGIENEQLTKAMQFLSRRSAEAASGLGEGKRAFDRLGLSAQNMMRMTPDRQFVQLTQAMQKVESQSERVNIALQVFGRSGLGVLNLINEAGSLEETLALAEKLGLSVSRFDAARIEQANDAITRMRYAFKGAANTVAIEFAPYVQALGDKITTLAADSNGFRNSIVDTFESGAVAVSHMLDILAKVPQAYTRIQIVGSFLEEMHLKAQRGILVGMKNKLFDPSIEIEEIDKEIRAKRMRTGEYLQKLTKQEETGEARAAKIKAMFAGLREYGETTAQATADSAAQRISETMNAAVTGDMFDSAGDILDGLVSEIDKHMQKVRNMDELLSVGLLNIDQYNVALRGLQTDIEKTLGIPEDPMSTFTTAMERLGDALQRGVISVDAYQRGVESATDSYERASGLEALRSKAQALFESTRTPLEKLQKDQAEWNQLMSLGLITRDTYDRALRKELEGIGAVNDEIDRWAGYGTAGSGTVGLTSFAPVMQEPKDVRYTPAQYKNIDAMLKGVPAAATAAPVIPNMAMAGASVGARESFYGAAQSVTGPELVRMAQLMQEVANNTRPNGQARWN